MRDQSGVLQPQRPSNAMTHGLWDQNLGLSSHPGGPDNGGLGLEQELTPS